jgi:uncharacterized membrane protein
MAKKKKINPGIRSNGESNKSTISKKEAVLGDDKKSNVTYIAAVILIAVASGLFYFISQGKTNAIATAGDNTQNVSYAETNVSAKGDGIISYDVSLFNDGKAKFFKYQSGKLTIKYCILKSSDGVIRAAFDACDVCWPEGKGYYQDGDEMVCRNCGRRFPSKLVNVVQGGCNPAPLKRRIENGKLVINVKDIIEGSSYFDFSKRS